VNQVSHLAETACRLPPVLTNGQVQADPYAAGMALWHCLYDPDPDPNSGSSPVRGRADSFVPHSAAHLYEDGTASRPPRDDPDDLAAGEMGDLRWPVCLRQDGTASHPRRPDQTRHCVVSRRVVYPLPAQCEIQESWLERNPTRLSQASDVQSRPSEVPTGTASHLHASPNVYPDRCFQNAWADHPPEMPACFPVCPT
jgi:hypothetical protein